MLICWLYQDLILFEQSSRLTASSKLTFDFLIYIFMTIDCQGSTLQSQGPIGLMTEQSLQAGRPGPLTGVVLKVKPNKGF